jgi:hypothetical protein
MAFTTFVLICLSISLASAIPLHDPRPIDLPRREAAIAIGTGSITINQIAHAKPAASTKTPYHPVLYEYAKLLAKHGGPSKDYTRAIEQAKQHGNSYTTRDGSHSKNSSGIVGPIAAEPQAYDEAYYLQLSIGNQNFWVDFDTGSSDFWIMGASVEREAANQTLYRPGPTATRLVGESFEITYGDGSIAAGSVWRDTVTLGGVKVAKQAIEMASEADGSYNPPMSGVVGLAFESINNGNLSSLSPPPPSFFFFLLHSYACIKLKRKKKKKRTNTASRPKPHPNPLLPPDLRIAHFPTHPKCKSPTQRARQLHLWQHSVSTVPRRHNLHASQHHSRLLGLHSARLGRGPESKTTRHNAQHKPQAGRHPRYRHQSDPGRARHRSRILPQRKRRDLRRVHCRRILLPLFSIAA